MDKNNKINSAPNERVEQDNNNHNEELQWDTTTIGKESRTIVTT